MKHKTLLTVMAFTILGASLIMPKAALADDDTWADHFNTMIEKLASKFNLNKNEVKSTFEEMRTQRQQERQKEMQAQFEARLNQAVKDGKITEDQKAKIMAKHQEMQKEQGSKRQEMQTWAEKNGIDMGWMMGFGGPRGMGRGFGGK